MQAWYLCEKQHPFVPQEMLDSVDPVHGGEQILRPAGRGAAV
jgi:hypothetical protein